MSQSELFNYQTTSEMFQPELSKSIFASCMKSHLKELVIISGVLDNVGIEPEVERIGKYKSAGDQLTCKTMSEENCEMLIALLNNVYEKWLDKVSSAKGKSREDLENFINQGVYQVEKLKEEGWITNKRYDDEVQNSTPRSRGLKYMRKNQYLLLHLLRILKDV